MHRCVGDRPPDRVALTSVPLTPRCRESRITAEQDRNRAPHMLAMIDLDTLLAVDRVERGKP